MTEKQPVEAGSRMSRWLWLAAALLGFAAFAQHFSGIGFTKKIAIEANAMEPDQGHAWRVRFPEKHCSRAAAYKLRILEDGVPKGELANSNRRVRDHGTGRYRLAENGILRFSASDNSSPALNGRQYVAEVPVTVRPWILGSALIVLAAAGFLARKQRPLPHQKPVPVGLLAAMVLVAAFGVSLWALGAYANYSDGGFAVKGSPYSDALAWTELALNLRDGHGFEGPFAGQRPLYPVVMATAYRFFGESLATGKMVNVFCGALSVMFVFLFIGHATRRWGIGLAAAAGLMWAKPQMMNVQLLATEPMGLTLILAGAYAWWAGLIRLNGWTLLIAGMLMGLSNLARTYTLLGLPFFALVTLAACRLEKVPWRRTILICAMLSIGATITLAPWMVRQKLLYDTFSLSANGADLLYGAAVDSPGWGTGLFEGLKAAGIQNSDIKETHNFFQNRYREEVGKNPGRYFKRLAGWFGAYLNHHDFKDPLSGFVILFSGLSAALAGWWSGRAFAGAGCLVCCALLVAVIETLPPMVIVLVASVLGLWLGDRRSRLALVVMLATLASGAAMSAMIGNFGLNRTAPLTAWVFPCTLLVGLAAAFRRVIDGKSEKKPAEAAKHAFSGVWRGVPRAISLAMIGLTCTSVLVVAATGFSSTGPSSDLQLTSAEQAAVRDWIREEIPATETASDAVFFTSLAKLTPYQATLLADEDTTHWARPFLPRPYDRMVAFLRIFDGVHPRGRLFAIQFRGELENPGEDALYVLAGVLNIDPNAPLSHDVKMIEALALVPFSEYPRKIRFTEAIRFPVTPEAAAILKSEAAP